VLGLACFGIVLGGWLKRLFPILDRVNIPASIAGGMVYAVAVFILRDRWLNFEMDMAVRDVLMVAFFTTVGVNASLRMVSTGGRLVLIFLALAVLGLVLQNAVGIAIAKAVGIDPLIGMLAGSISLTGGPATALAFGTTFEKLGVPSATVLGLASAIFGITIGGLISGYFGGRLIRAHGLRSAVKETTVEVAPTEQETESSLMSNVVVVGVSMGLGTLVSLALERLGLILPAYIGAMIVAAALRNLDDATRFVRLSPAWMDQIGSIALDIFIVKALLTLRLWELINLAVPVLTILIAQLALMALLCWSFLYRVMGRDYEAAVMSTGYSGFMLGTTANAMGCMQEIVKKHGPAPAAFLAVSLVGAFLIDFCNALVVTQTLNLLR
jgi:ESS family glutamate:Na+ symporter